MFPFFSTTSCCGKQTCSPRAFQEHRLNFLKWIRDDLEARLAGMNAAIETMERQLSRDEAA